ncbi:MAG: UDP-3-O-acyl-N-acetylglucosamine deacetylase [Hyphomicrobiales bacterium]|nr:UDP-3-O-acyl-N-acetylglucosamine deacetylase [Hyphomicrobiales bacterium]
MIGYRTGFQTTVRDRITLSGIGVHSGKPAEMTISPGDPNTGILFIVSDPDTGREVELRADHMNVSPTALATVLGDMDGTCVATVEHLLAAFSGLGVDNAIVEINNREVPVLDGSAAGFVEAIDRVRLTTLGAPKRFIKILKPIRVEEGAAFGELRPYDGFRLEVEIDFDCKSIGRQRYVGDLSPAAFRRDLARARTFGFLSDVEQLWAAGFAFGSSLENTVVIAEDRILNPEGLRWPDEFVRHKALDAVGDLSLLGAPILGCYRSYRGGHRLNFAMVKALVADPQAWTYVTPAARREVGHADLSVGLGAPTFAADVS